MLRVGFYNSRGLPKTRDAIWLQPDLEALLSSLDVLCLQETWMFKQDLGCLNDLHTDFFGFGTSTVDLSKGLCMGHAPGGVAILVREALQSCFEPLQLDLDWCCGAKFRIDNKTFLIINVYLPYQSTENEEEYLDKLGQLSAVLEEVDVTSYMIVGDWNANLDDTGRTLFGPHLLAFCQEHSLRLTSKELLPDDSFTYVSDSWGSTSWLDQAVTSSDMHSVISRMEIGYGIAQEDHMPVLMDMSVLKLPSMIMETEIKADKLDWENLDSQELAGYMEMTDLLLSDVDLPSAIHCTDTKCKLAVHMSEIHDLYESIIGCLCEAGNLVKTNCESAYRHRGKPGWSEHVSDLYQYSKDVLILWKLAGMPRDGPLYDEYKRARANSKYAIRCIKRHENDLKREALGRKLADMDTKGFWKKVKSMNKTKSPRPTTIEGTCGDDNIAALWGEHYRKLLNSVPSNPSDFDLEGDDSSMGETECEDTVTPDEVKQAILKLANGKSSGWGRWHCGRTPEVCLDSLACSPQPVLHSIPAARNSA